MAKIECEIERDRFTPGRSYVVTAGNVDLDVVVVSNTHLPHAGLKSWLKRVRLLYTDKNRKSKVIVGINAMNSHNTVGSRGVEKDSCYEILQICVGQHCLLIEIAPWDSVNMSVKSFLKKLFRDKLFVFVGMEIKDVTKKLYDDYKDTDFKGLSEIPNPVDLRELAAREPRFGFLKGGKCGLKVLVKVLLDAEYEKPERIAWYCQSNWSSEFILWSSVDVYLMAKMGVKLLYKSHFWKKDS